MGKDIDQCMRVCEESGLESEGGWGGGKLDFGLRGKVG